MYAIVYTKSCVKKIRGGKKVNDIREKKIVYPLITVDCTSLSTSITSGRQYEELFGKSFEHGFNHFIFRNTDFLSIYYSQRILQRLIKKFCDDNRRKMNISFAINPLFKTENYENAKQYFTDSLNSFFKRTKLTYVNCIYLEVDDSLSPETLDYYREIYSFMKNEKESGRTIALGLEINDYQLESPEYSSLYSLEFDSVIIKSEHMVETAKFAQNIKTSTPILLENKMINTALSVMNLYKSNPTVLKRKFNDSEEIKILLNLIEGGYSYNNLIMSLRDKNLDSLIINIDNGYLLEKVVSNHNNGLETTNWTEYLSKLRSLVENDLYFKYKELN
jgi:hypothetical protein